jgi:hypothetical protein
MRNGVKITYLCECVCVCVCCVFVCVRVRAPTVQNVGNGVRITWKGSDDPWMQAHLPKP